VYQQFPDPYRVIVGREDFAEVADQIAGSAVLITDEFLASEAIFSDLIDSPVLTIPVGEPDVETVDRLASRLPLDATLVAVGGGSVIDAVKLAAAAATTGDPVRTFLAGAGEPHNQLSVIAVPTSSGTGSEVTRTAIVSDNGVKTWAWGQALRPDLVLLEPELTVSCPPGLTAGAGIDALVHAIEACSGQAAIEAVQAVGSEAVDLIFTNLAATVQDGEVLEARTATQRAATLAGIAIDQSNTGLAHAIGHALSTLYGVPHGISVGIALHATIEWSMAGDPTRYSGLTESPQTLLSRIDHLFADIDFYAHAAPFFPRDLDPVRLAATMTSGENLPMCHNNSRVPGDSDFMGLSELTCDNWDVANS